MGRPAIDLSQLTSEEQLDLLDELWATLGRDPEAFPLTSEQAQDLDRRLDELEREGPTGLTWEETVASIRAGER